MQIFRKYSILYRFFCLADETFQLLEKTKVKMKILKTLKLGERPYEGSIDPTICFLTFILSNPGRLSL